MDPGVVYLCPMIQVLLDIGYPPERIKWYRGGLQRWLEAGLTSTKK